MQVKRFVQETKEAARARGFITTLGGRRRPIKALAGRGLSAQQAGAEADRKAVNSTIQGSAADLIKLAMCAWTRWQHAQMQPGKQPFTSTCCLAQSTCCSGASCTKSDSLHNCCLTQLDFVVGCVIVKHLQKSAGEIAYRDAQSCTSCGSDP